MEKKIEELIRQVYNEHKSDPKLKRLLILFAGNIKTVFTRQEMFDWLKEYFPNKNTMNTYFDEFISHDYKESEFNSVFRRCFSMSFGKGIPFRYTMTEKGDSLSFELMPKLTYELRYYLDKNPMAGYGNQKKLPGIKEKKKGVEAKLIEKCRETEQLLLSKNRLYGNSSLSPPDVFGTMERESKIEARIEDKLARIRYLTHEYEDRIDIDALLDAVRDLRGYLVLYEIALEDKYDKKSWGSIS